MIYILYDILFFWLYYTILYYIMLYYILLYYIIFYYTILYYIIFYYILLYYIISCFIILYIMLYYIVLYYIELYYITLYIECRIRCEYQRMSLHFAYFAKAGGWSRWAKHLVGAVCGSPGSEAQDSSHTSGKFSALPSTDVRRCAT